MRVNIAGLVFASAIVALPFSAVAQTYPSRVIKVVSPGSPGGGQDVTMRIIAPAMSKALGQPVIIEARSGAGGAIGASFVAKSPPDGYTLLIGNPGPNAIAPSIMPDITYDPVKDFAAISTLTTQPLYFVVPQGSPLKTLHDLIEQGKTGKLNFGSSGVGALSHLSGEMLNIMGQTKLTHIAFRGAGPLTTAVLGGQVDVALLSAVDALPHLKSGTLRALAVTTRSRFGATPDIPTVAEQGLPEYDIDIWYGLLAPAGTPSDIIARLNAVVADALKDPEIRSRLSETGSAVKGSSSEEFARIVADDTAKYRAILKTVDISTK
jgi:tripartite-type tricarboxylate transporter receptor subunit TctC